MTRHKRTGQVGCWTAGLLGLLAALAILALAVLTPWNIRGLASQPHPVASYAEAVQRMEARWPPDAPGLNPACGEHWLTHGQKAERAVILVHGYTECPYQFRMLGQRFYDLGYNVLIAPLPHHGLADRLTDEQALLTAEELAEYTDATVDIAQGLGEHVTMMGLSGGGVVTAWAAQNRSDLDTAVLISPGFGFKQVPTPLTAAAMNVYLLRPNAYTWWNSELKAEGSPPFQYPRYSTHALVQFLRLGFAVQASAGRGKPAAQKLVVVLNANDYLVNNEMSRRVALTWQDHGANLTVFEFEAGLKLPHDLVDMDPEDPSTEMVLSRLLELSVP